MLKKISSIITIVIGFFLVIAPLTFLHPCTGMEGACVHSSHAVELLAIVLIAIGIADFFVKEKSGSIALNLIRLLVAVEAILIPAKVIGGCEMQTMACHVKTFPGIYVASTILIVVTVITIIFEFLSSTSSEQ